MDWPRAATPWPSAPHTTARPPCRAEVAPGTRNRYRIRLTPAARVGGTVRTAEGGAVDHARVTLLDAAGTVVRTTTSDRDGAYVFTDLERGDYTLIAGGYPPVAASVRLGAAGRTECDIELGHDAAT